MMNFYFRTAHLSAINRLLTYSFPVITILGLILLSSSSCSSHKKNIATVPAPKKDATLSMLADKLMINRNEPEFFSAKLDIESADNYFIMKNFSANLRMHKDEAIWVSVSANLGLKIEVGRAYITPDSIMVMDKYNRQYYSKPFSYINSFLKYPLDFTTLQQLLWGNPPACAGVQSYENIGELIKVKTDSEFLWLDKTDYLLRKILLNDAASKKSLEVDYDRFESLSGKPFSTSRLFKFILPEIYQFQVYLSKLDNSGPYEMPFDISRYKRVD